jgi:hypothetical protein
MKEIILFFVVLISMMFLVEAMALVIPGWLMAASFFGLMFYGMFRLIRRSINMK